ncbi:hypothetical protein Tco_0712313 [Tanacetum coccineum]
MAEEVPQTLEYSGDQLNDDLMLEVENFTNWKRSAGVQKPKAQWTSDEIKAVNLNQRLKSLIMSVLPDDQMNYAINCETTKSTWDDLILYHEVPFNMKESTVIYKALINELVNDGIKLSKLEINTGFYTWLPRSENLIDGIYEIKKKKPLTTTTPLSTAFISTSIVQDFQDSPDDEDDTRNSQEYMNDLEMEFHKRDPLMVEEVPKTLEYKGGQLNAAPMLEDFQDSPDDEDDRRNNQEYMNDLEMELHERAKYNKGKTKLALLGSGASTSKSSQVRNQGLVAESYEWDKEEVSSDDNAMVEVKVPMALDDDESSVVGKESAKNGEWVKISMRKVHTLLEMEDNDERKSFLDYLGKENLLELKQAKLDFLTMQQSIIPPSESTVNVTESSVIDYDSTEESSSRYCLQQSPLPPLDKTSGVENLYLD